MDASNVKAALVALESGDNAAALEILKAMIVAEATDDPGDTGGDPAADPLAENADPKPPVGNDAGAAAMMTALSAITGCKSPGEVVAFFTSLKGRVDSLDAARATLDATSRRELVGELVKLGAELPATAWEGDADKMVPVKRLADEPIASMRSRVMQLRKARPTSTEITPPETERADVTKLTKRETTECVKQGMTPQEFADRKANAVRRSK